ncbi:hypothetical protein [Rudanella paleaurantiibacter]|uniref:hypothetical protein n=1 Tax=Rudanella paleaurantiibacter TaxID=2614655 RepID=UPI001FE9A210|nr:hypothetical protein [Rudanella paleaurantiibacter]
MKHQRIILVRSVSLLLVSLLLFLAGWGHSSTGHEIAGKAPVQKTEAAQKAGKTNAPAETQISAAAFEAVVTPATSFDFEQPFWLLPPPIMAVLLMLAAGTIRLLLTEPYFYFAYFRHVFGHFIAPNAP